MQNSSAIIESYIKLNKVVYVNVLLNVTNANDLKSSIELFGSSTLRDIKDEEDNFGLKKVKRMLKTKLVICTNKRMIPVRPSAKIGGMMKIGKQQPGDGLLHLEKVFVQPKYSKFPRHTFDFSDYGAIINEVTITASVSRTFLYDSLLCMI